ncbi:flagellar protein FlaG [Paenibacillus cremeus]|uniref:Flagellar protein FlaG n=2 Tax=Paenibacillus cremeus TaxID=2163881 RepID=A0A559KB84_9BACL|nr:flagellar protein FlaG [Paenibacillus cremeus]
MTSIKEVKEAQLEGKSIPVSEEQVVKAIERAIKAMEGTSTTLEFSIHEKTKHIMVKVLNKENGEVIREIPNEKTLDFLAKLWETAGIIIDKRR